MSADNWGACPKCIKVDSEVIQKTERSLADQYGKIAPEDYETLQRAVNQDKQALKDATELREDYEVYIDRSGNFIVSYGCKCYKCGFAFSYQYKKEVPL